MNISSFVFFVFVFFSLICYYLLPKKISYVSLLGFSLFFLFYNSLSAINIISVIMIFLISYVSGIFIDKYKNKGKRICVIGIIGILLVLCYLKYSSLFIGLVNNLFRQDFSLLDVESPVGISYFSLIMIGYIVDVYWSTNEAEKNPLKVLLFMIYYPILTSGPFIKYRDIKEELFNKQSFKIDNIINGFMRVLWGLFKVLIISTRISIFVTFVYSNLDNMNGIYVLLAIIAYTFELYTNFSGSIDIIMGVSKMFGINLPENFDNPFASSSITEFWRVWHITLGNWLRNYIFYPLLKNNFIQKFNKVCREKFGKKGKKIPTFLCMFILWFLIGFWHGGAFKFILASGILQFLYIVMEDIFGLVNKDGTKFRKLLRMIRTFILFSFSMVFFRASSVQQGILVFKNMFNMSNLNLIKDISLTVFDGVVIIVSLVILLVFDNNKDKIIKIYNNKSFEFRLGLILAFVLIILVLGVYGFGFNASEFIYGNF